eukprot:6185951-Pleurochrysis_carterae.AAC.2
MEQAASVVSIEDADAAVVQAIVSAPLARYGRLSPSQARWPRAPLLPCCQSHRQCLPLTRGKTCGACAACVVRRSREGGSKVGTGGGGRRLVVAGGSRLSRLPPRSTRHHVCRCGVAYLGGRHLASGRRCSAEEAASGSLGSWSKLSPWSGKSAPVHNAAALVTNA